MVKKYKLTFKKSISLNWNDLTDLDGYTQDNEKTYFPKTTWKKKPDFIIVEITKNDDGDIVVRDFERTALFPELYDVCEVQEML